MAFGHRVSSASVKSGTQRWVSRFLTDLFVFCANVFLLKIAFSTNFSLTYSNFIRKVCNATNRIWWRDFNLTRQFTIYTTLPYLLRKFTLRRRWTTSRIRTDRNGRTTTAKHSSSPATLPSLSRLLSCNGPILWSVRHDVTQLCTRACAITCWTSV